ncbi:MAG: hypothetical protein JST92_09655 [Deltaproteobacteria bacterium]|nr:hypothetical protein [Deltaproteobacteria bacterium]
MAIGLVVYDVLYLTLALCLYGAAFSAARQVFLRVAGWPSVLAFGAAAVTFLVALIACAAVCTALCPKLTPGRHKMMQGAPFFGWILRSMIRRILFVPGIKWFLFSSNVLRFLTLRALGADVAFTSNVSADADLLDPSLLTVGPGAVIGARCLVTGHFVEGGKLLLDRVEVGPGAVLAGEVAVLPGAKIGARAFVKGRVAVSLGAQIGEEARIGAGVGLDAGAKVGRRARIGNGVMVTARSQVPDGARLKPFTIFGQRVADSASDESTDKSAAPAV